MSFSDPHVILELALMGLLIGQEQREDVLGISILLDVIGEGASDDDLANVAWEHRVVNEDNIVDTSLDNVPWDEAKYIEGP